MSEVAHRPALADLVRDLARLNDEYLEALRGRLRRPLSDPDKQTLSAVIVTDPSIERVVKAGLKVSPSLLFAIAKELESREYSITAPPPVALRLVPAAANETESQHD